MLIRKRIDLWEGSQMPRARTQRSPKTEKLTCPECGKVFTRAASLGAHRNRAHGVAGVSSSARTRPTGGRRVARGRASAPRTTATHVGSATRRPGSVAARATTATKRGVAPTATRRRTPASKAVTGRRSTGSGPTTRRRLRRNGRVDRDALLRTLFPDGVPPREEAIRSVNRWLDEAERLAALKR